MPFSIGLSAHKSTTIYVSPSLAQMKLTLDNGGVMVEWLKPFGLRNEKNTRLKEGEKSQEMSNGDHLFTPQNVPHILGPMLAFYTTIILSLSNLKSSIKDYKMVLIKPLRTLRLFRGIFRMRYKI